MFSKINDWLDHAQDYICRLFFFRRGQWGQFGPTEIGIAPAGIDSAPLKGPLILTGRTM